MLDMPPMNPPQEDERRDFQRLREKLAGQQGPAYWRSLGELADTEEFREFVAKEFPRQAAPLENGLDRRDFLKLLGASMALAGLSACARPPLPHEKIVPYVRGPAEVVPGKPLFYATAVTYGGFAEGVLAESHQGRPTKLEGNPDHPASRGATGATTQAEVLALYDPDRSTTVMEGDQERTWDDFVAALGAAVGGLADGQGLAVLTENVTSPTLAAQLQQVLAAVPGASWYQWDPLHPDNEVAGARLAFGADVRPVYDLTRADVVVSLGADFLDRGPGRLAHARDFAQRRRALRADADMNRLYQLESSPSPTGVLADHRVPLRPSEIAAAAAVLAARLGVDAPAAEAPAGLSAALLDAMVADLQGAQGAAVVIAGAEQPPVVHALAAAMNAALGAVGTTVTYVANPAARPAVHVEEIAALTAAMRDGAVGALLVLGANPVYTAPADLGFADALARVPFSAHVGLYRDETALACTWHVPQTHFLETWGDARAYDGTVTITQPLILPFYGGKSHHEVLAALLGDPAATAYDVVRGYWQGRVSGDFEAFWRESVYRGVVAGTAEPPAAVTPAGSVAGPLPQGSDLEVVLTHDHGVLDGRLANNGWMQELPRPISKLTWDNAALMAPRTAERLNVGTGDVVTLTVDGRSVDVPVLVQPGQADGAVTVALGYGRTAGGSVANGVGVDAYPLLATATGHTAPVQVATTGRRYRLVTTQEHHALEGTGEARHIVRSGTLAQFRAEPEHPTFAHPVAHHSEDLYPDFVYEGYKWGMVIDQTVCTGCSACVVACQAENNVPIVGKEQVWRNREMHWLRVDSYYGGSIDDPRFYAQPMPCQHCEKAPCEPVCPVGATVHDSEGLNVMVYNRCVGTRYCSNNCPYKVRRFNYLQYAELDTSATPLSLANNPDVTVRSRGVMEKCTYCTQRISRARIEAANEDRRIRDLEVVTACQAACPTQAIVFGDLNLEGSAVNEMKASPINYTLLDDLQTFPRTSYLAKVTNPNPALEGSA